MQSVISFDEVGLTFRPVHSLSSCAPRDKIPVKKTKFVTSTSTKYKHTSIATKAKQALPTAGPSKRARELRIEPQPAPTIEPIDVDSSAALQKAASRDDKLIKHESGSCSVAADPSRLFKRHLCARCPANAILVKGSAKTGASQPRVCCPQRKTTTVTKAVRKTKTMTVSMTVSILLWSRRSVARDRPSDIESPMQSSSARRFPRRTLLQLYRQKVLRSGYGTCWYLDRPQDLWQAKWSPAGCELQQCKLDRSWSSKKVQPIPRLCG